MMQKDGQGGKGIQIDRRRGKWEDLEEDRKKREKKEATAKFKLLISKSLKTMHISFLFFFFFIINYQTGYHIARTQLI